MLYYNQSFFIVVVEVLFMAITKPRVFIIQENEDANLLLNGLLWLKGCESQKFIDGKECLEKISQFEGKVDVVIIGGNI